MATLPPIADDAARRNLRVGLMAFAGALAMLGLGYASVPLYRLFCQVTGFGGTTMQATESDAARAATLVTGQKISIRFDASVPADMPWTFHPSAPTDTITIGERDIATYVARNLGSTPVTGMATFNVTPEQAGKYFNKIQCFCFTEQTLQPGQEVMMPVLYYVDPAMLDDPNMQGVEQITLSYTFHRAKDPVNPVSTGTN
ncbi:cytochrome c oxidase assembly protein subunit 11 [Erythromicrobium ramosum]|uniref:Cytochrome c oxidase assembly protein CtaG n=1 Tax=Erythrobacter ramosus TaxID=35811 RepID=A0A6I4UM53_9SPHN|nr:cytochrome c oxidase assembly protein [Erythrobacter ramosus]MBB3776517.1 cytochrome c oxidase assembly protein subunit 11 [Erythrobacter ramosus]MXP38405.1 cytochrome c oxidase assembly protein [Erythrobacter ramosus]